MSKIPLQGENKELCASDKLVKLLCIGLGVTLGFWQVCFLLIFFKYFWTLSEMIVYCQILNSYCVFVLHSGRVGNCICHLEFAHSQTSGKKSTCICLVFLYFYILVDRYFCKEILFAFF